MKLSELKAQVAELTGLTSVTELKKEFPQWQQLNFRSKEVWEFVLQELQKQEQEEKEEQLIAEVQEEELAEAKENDDVLLAGGEVESEVSPELAEAVADIIVNPPLSRAMVRRREQAEEFLAAQRIAKQGTARQGTFGSRRVRSDKSRGFSQHIK